MNKLALWLTQELSSPGFRELDYAQAKVASEAIDLHLGFAQAQTEERLERANRLSAAGRPQQKWLGLPLASMQTPYSELAALIDTLAPSAGELWIDLGAAYGRMGIALGALAPSTRFIGYELVPERVSEGTRILSLLEFGNATLVAQDLAAPDFELPEADCYFIYDYGTREDVERTLADLQAIATRRPVTCVARGRGARSWIERGQPWLSQVIEPRHFGNYSIYSSATRTVG